MSESHSGEDGRSLGCDSSVADILEKVAGIEFLCFAFTGITTDGNVVVLGGDEPEDILYSLGTGVQVMEKHGVEVVIQ